MKSVKKIVVICGAGVATSVAMANALHDYLSDMEIETIIESVSVPDAENKIIGADLIVSLTNIKLQTDIPIVSGIPFLTGIGTEELMKTIETKIRD